MSPSEYSDRKELFAKAFRDFIDAHARGMKSLKEHDFRAFQDAVADECTAVENASAAITDVVKLPERRAEVEHRVSRDPDRSLEAEHARLFDHMRVLERDHRRLETRGDDLEAHREHRAKLEAHIADLRVHLQRLRAHGLPAPDQE